MISTSDRNLPNHSHFYWQQIPKHEARFVSSNWTTDDAVDLYNLKRWGLGFFDVNDAGQLVAKINNNVEISILDSIIRASEQHSIHAPFVVRLPHLIKERIEHINQAFAKAIEQFEYKGDYRCFFPAKVNQHQDVIQSAIEYGRKFQGGVEAGSKAELFALLLMTDNSVPILCNGFKDKAMIEMAFRGMQLGRDVTIILEKPSDLRLVIETQLRLGFAPKLGVRIKLAARSGGRWNASGGSKSKFGLSVSELMQVVDQLRQCNLLENLYLLHFHPGSQISNVRKIKSSIVEAGRIYVDLIQNGIPLTTIDVGGGLAIDYTGDSSQEPSSRNYKLEEYANDVVYYIQQVCCDVGVPEPNIISESGRAIAAHHSLIVVPVLEHQKPNTTLTDDELKLCEGNQQLEELKLISDTICPANLSESFHDTQISIETIWQLFSLGALTLQERSCAERLAESIFRRIGDMLGELEFIPSELEELRHRLAETYIANFSLFQAIPDSWSMNHIFPVLPIHRLNEKPTKRAVIGDITCDSDGQINCFIGSRGAKNSLPVHELIPGETYYIGIFLIGAYQEALSDDHNLMGNFHVLNLYEDHTIELRPGASITDVLQHVDHRIATLNESLEKSISSAALSSQEKQEVRDLFESVKHSYTYLSPNQEVPEPQIKRMDENHGQRLLRNRPKHSNTAN